MSLLVFVAGLVIFALSVRHAVREHRAEQARAQLGQIGTRGHLLRLKCGALLRLR